MNRDLAAGNGSSPDLAWTWSGLSRNDAVKIGECDRLGRGSRRRADCFGRGKGALNGLDAVRGNVFGQRPKTAGGTPALPIQTASFRLRVNSD